MTNFEQILDKTLSSEAKELFQIIIQVLNDKRTTKGIEEKVVKALWENTKDRKIKRLLRMTIEGLAERIYFQDGMATAHNIDPLKDELFVQSYELGQKRGGNKSLAYRAYIACWAAKKGANLEGDFVECGVFYGTLSRTIINYVGFENLNKKFYLLDTFL